MGQCRSNSISCGKPEGHDKGLVLLASSLLYYLVLLVALGINEVISARRVSRSRRYTVFGSWRDPIPA